MGEACPYCFGEGETFPNDVADWVRCEPCQGTGKRIETDD